MTTLLIDLNNLMMRNLFHKEVGATTDYPSYDLWKYLIFEQIYWSIIKFKEHKIDEVILAVDSPDSWRKIYFPRYKEKRASQRKEDIDWDSLFKQYELFQEDIKNNIPFKVLKVKNCEGDDIIGILCRNIDKYFIVISNDDDFSQLCSLSNTKVWIPKKENFSVCEDTENFITRLAVKGQSKDGIFNVKTPEDYPNELRKPGLGDKTVDKILSEGLDSFLDKKITINKKYTDEDGQDKEYKSEFLPRERFNRNKVLLDFRNIPSTLTKNVLKMYNEYTLPEIDTLYEFFERQGWNSFLNSYDITEKVLMKLK